MVVELVGAFLHHLFVSGVFIDFWFGRYPVVLGEVAEIVFPDIGAVVVEVQEIPLFALGVDDIVLFPAFIS